MVATARPSNLGTFEWSTESSFAEDSSSVSNRMQLRNASVDVSSLVRELIDRGGTQQRVGEGQSNIPGPFGVSTFVTEFDLYGHGSTTAGSLTSTALTDLLAHVLGHKNTAQVGGQDDGAGDSDTLSLDGGSENLVEGALIRCGAAQDGRGNGQVYPVTSPSGTPTTSADLLVGMAAALNDNDIVYAMQVLFPVTGHADLDLVSSDASENNTLRILLSTANQQWLCHGCAPQSVSLSGLAPGEIPRISITWQCVHFEPISGTFPSATATADHAPAPVGRGSMFIQAKGTTTRSGATYQARNVAIDLGIGCTPIMGPDGVHDGQNVVGYTRTDGPCTISMDVPAEALTANPTWHDYFSTDPNSITHKHICYTLNPIDGRSVGIYLPNCKPIGNVPTQSEVESLNYVPLQFQALTNDVTTSELTLSRFRIGVG